MSSWRPRMPRTLDCPTLARIQSTTEYLFSGRNPVSLHGRKLVATFGDDREGFWAMSKTRHSHDGVEDEAVTGRDRSRLLLEINAAMISHAELPELLRAVS